MPQIGKYGRLAPRHDPRRLRLANYLTTDLPPAPPTANWTTAVGADWGMMLNDRIGICTCADAGHMEMSWSANAGSTPIKPTDDDILKAYVAVAGYDPTTGANDNGASEIDVLNYWRTTGIAGNRIAAYAAVDTRDLNAVKHAIYLFGGLYLGINVPNSAEQQFAADQPWTVPWFSWIVGAHAIPVLGYDDNWLPVITWGKVQPMSWGFFQRYCEEAYAIVDEAWLASPQGISPSGLDLAQLQTDLAAF